MVPRPARALLFRVTSQILCFTLLAQTWPVAAQETPPPSAGFDVRWLGDNPPGDLPAPARAEEGKKEQKEKEPTPHSASTTAGGPPPSPSFGSSTVPPGGPVVLPAGLTAPYLLPGYNLVSLPRQPADPSPEAIFSSLAGKYTRVYALSLCSPEPWKVYDPADLAGSDLTALDPSLGFWIEMTEPAALPSVGPVPEQATIHLCRGWNLIGFPAEQARPVRTALDSIDGKYLRVYGFDPADPADPWELYDTAIPSWANDMEVLQPGRGYWLLMTEDASLTISSLATEPDLALAVPGDLSEVTAPIDVTGTVRSGTLESWSLAWRAHGDPQATVFASGRTPVVDGRLGTFDPTLLLNGGYSLELTVHDLSGESTTVTRDVSIEGQMKIGHFTLSFQDLEIPLSGLPIQILRIYDSRDKARGDFGTGWRLELRQGSYRNNRKPGDGWQFGQSFLPCDQIGETRSHLTTIRLSDREVYRFKLALFQGVPTLGGCFGQARFDFVDGPVPGATLDILGPAQVLAPNGANEVLDPDTLAVYEPQQVRLTTRDGRSFDLDLRQGVTRIADLNGNALSITPAGITHTSGLAVAFERDTLGRITRIADAEGAGLTYRYDAAGDLVEAADRQDNATRFTYAANHHLLEITDPLGRKPIRNEYDTAGRLIRSIDAFGQAIEIAHDLAARLEVITDRLGHSRLLEYDERGNVTRETDPLGHVTVRTFDDNDLLLSETDPLGHTTLYAYDAGRNLASLTDPLGHRTSFTFDARGQVLTATDPRGKVTRNVYDGNGNLLETVDPAAAKTIWTYDAQGNLVGEIDALGQETSFTYDGFGNLTHQVDALGHAATSTYDRNGNRLSETTTRTRANGSIETLSTTFRYDSDGRLTATVRPDGTSTQTVYDALGQVAETIDPLGRRTVFTYDELGRQTATRHPDGTSESRAYDAEGRLVASFDRAGRATTYLYDAVGRLTKTLLADGSSTTSLYDAAGSLVATTDARNSTTSYEHDASGRRTRVLDPLLGQTDFEYDAAGHQVGITDANRQTTRFVYDDAGQLVRTLFPDGTTHEMGYDALGRRISETDQASRTTRFGYDALGRLLTVTDALNQVTRYAYDEVGNQIEQNDANAHTTRFEHDALGRRIRRVLPDGAAEAMSYDAAGNLTGRTDFLGRNIQFSYDIADRLIAKIYPDGSNVTWTYTATGQRATMVDGRGSTSYRYDQRDRLVEKVDTDGRRLTYVWDPNGNRTELMAHVAGQVLRTQSSYDALNRLARATDPQGRIFDHGYDANGNRTSVAYPNGVQTHYTHDSLNRLRELRTRTSPGTVVQSYLYTLGPAGNRTRIEEHDGTVRGYGYDALDRLIREGVDRGTNAVYNKVFHYDPVGNRLQQVHTDAAGTVTTTNATYDPRDRQLTRGAQSWTWDANGNLTAKHEEAAYAWDLDDRLQQVALPDGTVITHTYDPDGVRVRTETRTPDGTTTVVDYLVDTSGPLSQVVAETAGGLLAAYYVRGDDLLAVLRPGPAEGTWTSRFYHADGLGSIRALTNEAGEVTDRYAFTAFGELLSHEGDDPNAYLFAGEMLDPNAGFYYNRARWMDPGAGRFASMDPFGGFLTEPQTLHRYLYAALDPVLSTDPTGLTTFTDVATAMQVVATNMTSSVVRGLIGVYRASTVQRAIKAGEWTWQVLDIAQAIGRAANGDITAAMEVAMELSSGKLDLILKSTKTAGRLLRLEVKNLDFDGLAWMPDGVWNRFLMEKVDQARRFAAEGETKYLLKNFPQAQRGKDRLEDFTKQLEAAGVNEFAVGVEQVRILLTRELS